MMSQIRPHFIFNNLSTIRYLCKHSTEDAVTTIDKFSGFLRESMDSITRKTPIEFVKELGIVRNYVDLEMQRFSDQLEVKFDIQSDTFTIPALSIQPLVENAIKHGFRSRIDKGCVTISSVEKKDSYHVIVKDDGVGFDTSASKNDGKTHLGLQNVRNRIELMCNGRLDIHSEIGKGTTITIILPKSR